MFTFSKAFEAYIDELLFIKNYSHHTIRAYQSDILQWHQYLITSNISWSSFSKDDIISFFSFLLDLSLITRKTQARKLISLRRFYDFCLQREYITRNVFSLLSSPKVPQRLPAVITSSEMAKFLDSQTMQKDFLQLRDRAIFELLYSSGARVSELLYLNIQDMVSFDGQILEECKVFGKHRKERIIFCTNLAKKTLADYLNLRKKYFPQRDEDLFYEPLFINMRGGRLSDRGVRYILKQRKKHLALHSDSTVHSFRHSFATDLMNSGVDIRRIQEMLGHSSIKTTQRYTHIAKEQMIATFRKTHPHAKRSNLV